MEEQAAYETGNHVEGSKMFPKIPTQWPADVIDGMQQENQRLIEVLEFYAKRKNWQQRTAQMDNGARAREILKEVIGL